MRQHVEGKLIERNGRIIEWEFHKSLLLLLLLHVQGGWWWKSCGRGLNGLYLHDPQDLTARQGIVWFRWRGWDYTLKKATMMIKPRGLQPVTTTATNT